MNFSYPLYAPKRFDIELDTGEADEDTMPASTENAEPGTELSYGIRTPAEQSTVAVTVEDKWTSTERTT
ncbi:hypothetical protein ACFQJ7_16780 [Halovenus rubra]|uniref:Uncharacterized protein n=2 Tax=Halovenus rubra TaxID=869890 RepID=A0ABD5X920_9EURY|nr:hypothetical protein [Halovenus rubra]